MNVLMDTSPLPANGRWWEDGSWAEAFDVFGEDLARAALAEVDRYIPARDARRMTWRGGHPFLFDYWQRAGRYELILLGLGLLCLQPRRIRGRLRAAEHYVRAKAEVRVGLLLASLGMQLVHEPDGGDERGPDWLCQVDPNIALRIEVKCPNWSESARLRSLAVVSLMNSFVEGIGDISNRLDTGTWLTIAPSPDLVERVIPNRRVDDAYAHRVGSAAGQRVAMLQWPLADGRYAVENFGSINVKRGAGEECRLHVSGDPIPLDAEREAAKLRNLLEHAAAQLKRVTPAANAIAIDCTNDSLITSRTEIIEAILGEPWAEHVAGVLLVDDVSESIRPSYAMHAVRGSAQSRAFDALAHRLRACPRIV